VTYQEECVSLARTAPREDKDTPMMNTSHKRRPKRALPVLMLATGLALGLLWPSVAQEQGSPPPGDPLAYVLVSGRVIDDTGLAAYGEAAGPLAQAAGINVVARAEAANVQVMEGEWPYGDGFVAIETFRSMDDFKAFWNSPGYQEAIELRKGKVELDFVVALEGLPDSS